MKMEEVSAELRALAGQHGLKRLAELADAIDHRDTPKMYKVGDELAAQIRTYRHKNPDVSDAQVAFRFGLEEEHVKKIRLAPKPFAPSVKVKAKVKK